MLSSINNWATAGNDPTSWSLGSMGFQASLQPYMSDLLLLKGMDYSFIKDMPGSGERTGHACFAGMLTGAFYKLLSSATSSDQPAEFPSISTSATSSRRMATRGWSASIRGRWSSSTGHLSWAGPGEIVQPNRRSQQRLQLCTSKARSRARMPAPATQVDRRCWRRGGAPVDNTNAIQKSILDSVVGDLNRFSNIVGTEDKQSIDEHLTSISAIETRLP